MTASDFVLVRRSDLEVALDGYSHAVRDRLRAALAADQVRGLTRIVANARGISGATEYDARIARAVLGGREGCGHPNHGNPDHDCRPFLPARPLPIHRTEASYPHCATCDGGGCPDCTDPA